jgi:tyrosyl-tRNA synthetase
VGGATGLVGDPTGRSEERQPADPAKIKYNVTKLQLLTEKFFESAALYAKARLQPSGKHVHEPRLLDNTEWLQGLKLLDFLRTGGVHVRLGTMLARERCVILSL